MIAERCSIKAPSLYKHFKSKKEIFEEVYNHSCKKLDNVISQIALKESEEKNISEDILFNKQKEIVNLLIHDDEIKRLIDYCKNHRTSSRAKRMLAVADKKTICKKIDLYFAIANWSIHIGI